VHEHEEGIDALLPPVRETVDMISKTLFGTMDAEDATLINEQLKLLQNKLLTLQCVTRNQTKVLNATIGHISRENIGL